MVMSLLEPEDEIVIFTPNYLQISGWARALGISVKTVAHREEFDWEPDFDELESLVTPKTKLVSICHPNNPTGMVLDASAMQQLVALAADNDLYLHADEIYKGSELSGPEPPSFLDLYDKAIVTNGLSKAMALPGLRIGWLAGPAEDIYAAWQRKDYTSITTAALSEYVAERALDPGRRRRILDRSKDILRDNLSLLSDWVSAHSNRFSFVPPRAGGMAFVRYFHSMNSTRLVRALIHEKDVLLLPGDVYGLDGHVRIGIGGIREHLEEGLGRVSDFFRKNSP